MSAAAGAARPTVRSMADLVGVPVGEWMEHRWCASSDPRVPGLLVGRMPLVLHQGKRNLKYRLWVVEEEADRAALSEALSSPIEVVEDRAAGFSYVAFPALDANHAGRPRAARTTTVAAVFAPAGRDWPWIYVSCNPAAGPFRPDLIRGVYGYDVFPNPNDLRRHRRMIEEGVRRGGAAGRFETVEMARGAL